MEIQHILIQPDTSNQQEIHNHPQIQNPTQPTNHPQKVSKPSTPYMIFLKKYKQDLKQGDKFNLKMVAQIWNTFDQKEKDVYSRIQQEQRERYDQYLKECVERGIELEDRKKVNLEFPTTRIKNIMRQDKTVKCKNTTAIYMTKAVELFGAHMVGIVKRNIGAKKKVELKDLWEAINVDRSLGFLQPIIDDFRNSSTEKPIQKKRITLEVEKPENKERGETKEPRESKQKESAPIKPKPSTKRVSSAQPTLNDLWK